MLCTWRVQSKIGSFDPRAHVHAPLWQIGRVLVTSGHEWDAHWALFVHGATPGVVGCLAIYIPKSSMSMGENAGCAACCVCCCSACCAGSAAPNCACCAGSAPPPNWAVGAADEAGEE